MLKNKKRNFYIRNSAVLAADTNEKMWREIFFCIYDNAILITSDFDHYTKTKRTSMSCVVDTIFIKTPGYKKNTSLSRIFDAHIFGIKTFFLLLFYKTDIDRVYIAYPTPETLLYISFLKLFRRNLKLVIDVRDAWPRALNVKNNLLKNIFELYISLLDFFTLKSFTNVIYMSKNLESYYCSLSMFKTKDVNILPNPLINNVFLDNKLNFVNKKLNKRIAFFGTLNDQFDFKPLEYLLDNSFFVDWQIDIFGNGYNKSVLESQFARFENVNFKGFLNYNDLIKYSSINVDAFFCFFTSPENYENHLSNKIVEYISLKKPIITNFENNKIDFNDSKLNLGIKFTDDILNCEDSFVNYINNFDQDLSCLSNNYFKNYFENL